jgi:hypothetical protein
VHKGALSVNMTIAKMRLVRGLLHDAAVLVCDVRMRVSWKTVWMTWLDPAETTQWDEAGDSEFEVWLDGYRCCGCEMWDMVSRCN